MALGEWAADRLIRSRLVLRGTVGGRMAATSCPRSIKPREIANSRSGSEIKTGTIGPCESGQLGSPSLLSPSRNRFDTVQT